MSVTKNPGMTLLILGACALYSNGQVPSPDTKADSVSVCAPNTSGSCVTAPVPIKSPDPKYSSKARKAGLEGLVVLSAVIGVDGMPQNIEVKQSLGMGLDEEAIKAVKHWRFKPALKNGKPVAVPLNVKVAFHLH